MNPITTLQEEQAKRFATVMAMRPTREDELNLLTSSTTEAYVAGLSFAREIVRRTHVEKPRSDEEWKVYEIKKMIVEETTTEIETALTEELKKHGV